jgi:transposase
MPAMTSPKDLASLSREDLLALVAELPRQIAELRASNEALRAEIDPLKRGGTRQAAPCSKGTRVAEPKPPGRPPGAGPFHYREAPPPEAITEPSVDVGGFLDACPAGGGPLAEECVDLADTTAWPDFPRPKVTQYRVWVCRCTVCGRQVRGQHPDLAPDQYGATAHRLGARVRAAAHTLHDGVGIPVRKVPAVLKALSGVQLTQGALTQDALRRVQGPLGTAYEGWRAAVPQAPVVHTDDTGGRVGGEPASLLAFETKAATVSHIRPRHRHGDVPEVIPADDAGVRVTDRGRSDDARAFDDVPPQKCLAPIPRSLRDVLATQTGRARDFGEPLKGLLQEAMARWHAYGDGDRTDYKGEVEALQAAITDHLRDRRLKDADHQRRLNERGWHHDRGNLVRLLADPRVEPTNNRAEQAWRPAVIARTVAQCSKNGRGAGAFAAVTRVIRTLMKTQAGAVVETLSHLWRPPQPQHVHP